MRVIFITSIIIHTMLSLCIAQQKVGGTITEDTRWRAESGPYIIVSDLIIERNARLTINPGTQIIISTPNDTNSLKTAQDNKQLISIKVYGVLQCIGRMNRRITIAPETSGNFNTWQGIILDGTNGDFTEIAFTDIAGACNGIEISKSDPLIRNCIIEYNHIGIYCKNRGNSRIYNNVIVYNKASGIRNELSNPVIFNNIIAYNHNNGIQNDIYSNMVIEYNCIYGNLDGNFFDCNPELGIETKTNKNNDSVDIAYNIFKDPVFSGSVSDSIAAEQDVRIPTDLSNVKNTALAKIIHSGKTAKPLKRTAQSGRYTLSGYSPCIDAGNPLKKFNNTDGSTNDCGIYGGPEFFREF